MRILKPYRAPDWHYFGGWPVFLRHSVKNKSLAERHAKKLRREGGRDLVVRVVKFPRRTASGCLYGVYSSTSPRGIARMKQRRRR